MAYIAPKVVWNADDAIDKVTMERIEGDIDYLYRNQGDSSGNVFRSTTIPIPYTPTADVTSIPIPELLPNQMVLLNSVNQVPVLGTDYTVDYENKKVNLTFTVEANTTIYYTLEIDANAMVAPGDNGNIEIGGEQIQVYRIAGDLSTSLTETTTGKSADATVAKTLNDDIKFLSINRGYKTSPRISDDASAFIYNGKYFISGPALNNPIGQPGYIEVTAHDTNPALYCAQKYTCAVIPDTIYERILLNGVWQPWVRILTSNLTTNGNLPSGDIFTWAMNQTVTQNALIQPVCTGLPIASMYWNCELIIFGGGSRLLRVSSISSSGSYYNLYNSASWLGWTNIATTEKIDITLTGGATYEGAGKLSVFKTGNMINCCFDMNVPSTAGVILFTLPYGPSMSTNIWCARSDGVMSKFTLYTSGAFTARTIAGGVYTISFNVGL